MLDVPEERVGAATWMLTGVPRSLWITGNALLPFPQFLCNPHSPTVKAGPPVLKIQVEDLIQMTFFPRSCLGYHGPFLLQKTELRNAKPRPSHANQTRERLVTLKILLLRAPQYNKQYQ